MSSSSSYSSSSSSSGRPEGPFGIDPLYFAIGLFGALVLFVFYLMLPRALRKQYFGAYPKRHAWSARSRNNNINNAASNNGIHSNNNHRRPTTTQPPSITTGTYMGGGGNNISSTTNNNMRSGLMSPPVIGLDEEASRFYEAGNDEIVISAAMQQLREPGVLIVAHGSRGKPKTVRLQLTEAAITWRTETRKNNASQKGSNMMNKPKLGKLHQVPLSHIMYVDVGKQTTALRRVENASVSEALCFSLLTKEGSLDLEAASPRERDALVSCFSMVLDEVHAQNWRDIYRGPSSDMPSSFDELDPDAANNNNNNAAAKV